jgi:hypothetical protein
MSEAPKERRPWLILPKAIAILILLAIIFVSLNWLFDTVWWHDYSSFMKSKIIDP